MPRVWLGGHSGRCDAVSARWNRDGKEPRPSPVTRGFCRPAPRPTRGSPSVPTPRPPPRLGRYLRDPAPAPPPPRANGGDVHPAAATAPRTWPPAAHRNSSAAQPESKRADPARRTAKRPAAIHDPNVIYFRPLSPTGRVPRHRERGIVRPPDQHQRGQDRTRRTRGGCSHLSAIIRNGTYPAR